MANIVTVRGAVKQAKADGYPISEYAIRHWLQSGEIPCRKSGNRHLIFYPALLKYLSCCDDVDLFIRHIPEANR